MRQQARPVVLAILDGVGIGPDGAPDDAVAAARTPHLDALTGPSGGLPLAAHGRAVGLPSDNDMGNSEVGHNTMGAGRIIEQGASLIAAALADGSLWEGTTWQWLCDGARAPGATLHLLGLLSDGGVHSHIDHVLALLDGAARAGVPRVRLHLLLDGRDVAGRSALVYLATLQRHLDRLRDDGVDASIASGGGRMVITMDRYEADWAMVARGWATHVHGEAEPAISAQAAVERAYAAHPTADDQWIPPFVVVDAQGQPLGPIRDGDSVLCFHFRGDRALEISRAFEDDAFTAFDRGPRPNVRYAGAMVYDGDLGIPRRALVPPPAIDDTVGRRLADAGLRTFAVAETQKFGHVTYFFNGNRSGYVAPDLERYVEVPSDRRPFNEAPWMKAAEVTDAAIAAIASGDYDHIRINYANGDMVGHTGDWEATLVAVQAVDLCLGRLREAVRQANGILLVTADHGNADGMWQRDAKGRPLRDEDGRPLPRTSHTLAAVPFLLEANGAAWRLRDDLTHPGIASVGSTLLDLLDVAIPPGWAPSLVARVRA
ncbi:MAG: Phosphoglycerate mutase [Pseudomonadota bacterium]|jgi:2,3-bisphosphoglycerate-independent phosphoglycerate mutase